MNAFGRPPQYRIDAGSLYTIKRIDRETRCFWMEKCEALNGHIYYSRTRKQPYYDRVFDTFDEAKRSLVRRLAMRLVKAEEMVGTGEYATNLRDEDGVAS